MTINTDRMLLVFARAPVEGKVKTRLQPPLDAAQAVELHLDMLERTLMTAAASAVSKRRLYCDIPDHPVILDIAARARIPVYAQRGMDLGERMEMALTEALLEVRQAVLIGCDCPEITPAYIDDAFETLSLGKQVVLGPARDGGYVLIGLCEADPRLFEGICWGTETVLIETRRRLRRNREVVAGTQLPARSRSPRRSGLL